MADSKDLVAETVALKQTVKEILAAVAAQDEKVGTRREIMTPQRSGV